jgi:hypothetical protein
MTPLPKGLLAFERLATNSTAVEPAEVSIALGRLYDACNDATGRKLINQLGTCCEHLLAVRPDGGWQTSYEMEVWGDHLLDLCEQLRENSEK